MNDPNDRFRPNWKFQPKLTRFQMQLDRQEAIIRELETRIEKLEKWREAVQTLMEGTTH